MLTHKDGSSGGQDPANMSLPERLYWLMTHNEAQPVIFTTTGSPALSYKLWVPPESIAKTLEANFVENATVGGDYVINDYLTKPYVWNIVGSTGTMGDYDMESSTAFAAFYPQHGRPLKFMKLSVPSHGVNNLCIVTHWVWRVTNAEPFFNYYEGTLRCYPSPIQGYNRVTSNTLLSNSLRKPPGYGRLKNGP